MMNEKALCTARELAIGYGKTPLLSDICLGVQPGQILTSIGPNGAGKSTLLNTLAGQLAPMGGTVLLAGRRILPITPVPSGRRSWPSWPRTAAGWS
ncbi:MAG: ATP-binding cassette domain-containing protein [Faecalibacterium sp.]